MPTGWRDRMLIEFVGWQTPDEWLSPAQFDLTPSQDAGLINGASNRWTALRIVNASMNVLVADYRPPRTGGKGATNFTEIFDATADEFIVNLAVGNRIPTGSIEALRDELWSVADCVGDECP